MSDSDLGNTCSHNTPSKVSRGQHSAGPRLIWGSSAVMRAIRAQLQQLAQSDCSVLLVGETGTGKGMLARAIHEASPRAHQAFVHVDCAALAPSMIESEFFGHERGAFTGASTRRMGRFELAAAGTIFLDEIAELPPGLQGKLLRVLHDRRYERVGGTQTLGMSARVLAATHYDLRERLSRGEFRPDLYYRLAVAEIGLPPLRDRLSDIDAIVGEARRVVSLRLGRIILPPTADALRMLRSYEWPGNAREVFNLVERIGACWPGRSFDAALVAEVMNSRLPSSHSIRDKVKSGSRVGDLELMLQRCQGNVSLAARRLGIPRSTLRYRLARLHRQRELHSCPGRGAISEPPVPDC